MNGLRKEHTKRLFSARMGFVLRAAALAGLAGMLIFVFGLPHGSYVRAAPLFQDTPGYNEPPPEDDGGGEDGYGSPETETPFPDESPAADPTDIVEPTIELTPTGTSTPPVDVFRTEDAEIDDAQTTLVATEAFDPTITPYRTPTVTTKTPRSTLNSTEAKEKDGFTPDWGLFWIGFSVPVLGACGVVLYLLDRRPDLFRHGK